MPRRPAPHRSGRRVLIVEDEGIVAADIEKSLLDLDFEVTGIAASGQDAIDKALADPPDLVLMDVRIQGPLDGIATAQRLRDALDVPVVYLTAHGDKETVARAKATDPLAFLVKPFKPTELQSTVEIALYRHDALRRLRERERWLHTTLRAIADAVISVDLEQRVILMNPAAEALIGVLSDDAVGEPIGHVVDLEDENGEPLPEIPTSAALREMRARWVAEAGLRSRLDGTLRPVRVSAAPVSDGERTLGAVMVLADITEQKRLRSAEREAELQRIRSEHAEAAVHQRDEFIAVAAHELRSPLTALLLNLEGLYRKLKESALPFELLARLDRAVQHTRRLGDLVERLLDVSRIVHGRLGLKREHGDVRRVAEDVVEALAEQAAAAGCAVEVKASGDSAASFDALRIRQVVMNLVSNAIKFGRGRPIEVLVEGGADAVRLSVVDHGVGISASDAERIFDRFERAVSVRHYGGLGLGLFIARHIVEAHGGALTLRATPGGGATFVVALPSEGAEPGSRETTRGER